MKSYAVVYYEDEGVYTVYAHKVTETNSLKQAETIVNKSPYGYAVVRNFDGQDINANYVQQIYPETVE